MITRRVSLEVERPDDVLGRGQLEIVRRDDGVALSKPFDDLDRVVAGSEAVHVKGCRAHVRTGRVRKLGLAVARAETRERRGG